MRPKGILPHTSSIILQDLGEGQWTAIILFNKFQQKIVLITRVIEQGMQEDWWECSLEVGQKLEKALDIENPQQLQENNKHDGQKLLPEGREEIDGLQKSNGHYHQEGRTGCPKSCIWAQIG